MDSFEVGIVRGAREGDVAFGRVKLWGRVFPYEQGWRAQFARPLSLYRLWPKQREDELQVIAEGYGIPIEEPPPGLVERLDFVLRQLSHEELWGAYRSYAQQVTATQLAMAQQYRQQVSQHAHYFASPLPSVVRPAPFSRALFIVNSSAVVVNLGVVLGDVLTNGWSGLPWWNLAAVAVGVPVSYLCWRRWMKKTAPEP